MGFFVIAHVIMPSDTPSNGTAGPHIPSTPLSTSSQSFTITLHLLLNSFLPFSLSLRSPIVSVRRTATVCIKSMAEKREKEETKLKVPETLSLCTPAIPAATSTISGSDEHRSSPDRSDLATGVVLESRSSTAISPKLPDLHKKRPLETVESSNDDDVKRLKRRDVNRCSGCRRKVGLMGFRCRCGEIFCSDHRYSDRHDCSYDYKAAGREAIARENPVVRAAKIVKV